MLDVNVVIISFLFATSNPQKAVEKARYWGTILISDSIYIELEEVVRRQKFDRYLPLIERQELLATFAESSLFIEPTEQINECRDPKDNKYLELAVAGQAECIASGDNDLLVLQPFRGIDILTVQEFLAIDVNET